MLVAELNGLLDEHALIGVVAGQVEHCDAAAKGSGESDEGQDAQPGVDVGVAMKDLTHRVAARVRVLSRAYSKPGLCRRHRISRVCRCDPANEAPRLIM